MITLYADALWESPWVFSAFVALEEKGVVYETRLLDLDRGEQRKPEFVSRALTARVPTLEHDGFFLGESTAIIEYLEETFAPPAHPALFPAARAERARARQILGWMRTDLVALRSERPSSTLFFSPKTQPLSDRARADSDKLLRVAHELIRAADAPLFERWSIADAELAFALERLIVNGDPLPELLRGYAETQWARPSIRAFAARERPAVH